MRKPRFSSFNRLIVTLLIILNLALMITPVSGYLTPILIDTDPTMDSPASIDILEVYLTNNGTHFRFIIKCRSVPYPSKSTIYRVYLDTKSGGTPDGLYKGADYYLEAKDDSYLYEWKEKKKHGAWYKKSPIEVQIDPMNKTISLTASLSDIGYPKDVWPEVGIVVATFQPSNSLRDRAPDTGHYTVAHEVIPELPWPTPVVFIPAVVGTIYTIYRRRSRENERRKI